MDFSDHFSPTLIWLHVLEKLSLSVKDTYPCGSAHFVAGEGEEVAVQVLNVDRHVRDRLRTVHQNFAAMFVSLARQFSYGVDCSQHVGDMRNSEELDSRLLQMLVYIFSDKLSVIRDSNIFETRSFFTRELLPWDDVAVVLHLREHDAVPESNIGSAPGMGYKVDCLGCSADEDYLRSVPSVASMTWTGFCEVAALSR